ncbi:MAG TPA: hypothetical protein VFX47_05285 [Gammaproteobacteria bacterium]|nr:hypothetical protein [Gammaproteobacteria bacterium]
MRYLHALTLLALAGCASVAHADRDEAYAPGLGAAIAVTRVHTGFAYPAANHDADLTRYTVIITQAFAADLDFGIEGGYQLAEIGSPALAGLENTAGHTLGLSGAWHPRLGNYLSLELQAGSRWNDAEFADASRHAELVWYQSYAAIGPVLYLYNWRLSAGLRWQHDDGHEDDRGPPTLRQDFSAAHSTGSYLGVTYYLDRTGSVALYGFGGGQRGAELVFKREF